MIPSWGRANRAAIEKGGVEKNMPIRARRPACHSVGHHLGGELSDPLEILYECREVPASGHPS
jgi:hypothetical protein